MLMLCDPGTASGTLKTCSEYCNIYQISRNVISEQLKTKADLRIN